MEVTRITIGPHRPVGGLGSVLSAANLAFNLDDGRPF